MSISVLSALVLTPTLGAIALALLPTTDDAQIRRAALGFSLVPLVISLAVLMTFDSGTADFQMVERLAWIPDFGVSYHLGIDGISLFLVVLTTLLTTLVILNGFGDVHRRVREYMVLMLVLETGMLGAFVALDLFLFYVFWEVMLVPMYLLIGVWGGARRIYAAVKFALYTMFGSLLMLVAILYLAWLHKAATGGLELRPASPVRAPDRCRYAALAVRGLRPGVCDQGANVPVSHLASRRTCRGADGRFSDSCWRTPQDGDVRFPAFRPAAVPRGDHQAAPLLMAVAVVGIVYGALVAMVQPDLKKLVAYSSVSHLGFVMLGLMALNPEGATGAVYQMLNHGLSTGALFLCVGVIYERFHTRQIADLGGLWQILPVYSAFFLIVMLSSVGLPGLNGFVGEFLILLAPSGPPPSGPSWRFRGLSSGRSTSLGCSSGSSSDRFATRSTVR